MNSNFRPSAVIAGFDVPTQLAGSGRQLSRKAGAIQTNRPQKPLIHVKQFHIGLTDEWKVPCYSVARIYMIPL